MSKFLSVSRKGVPHPFALSAKGCAPKISVVKLTRNSGVRCSHPCQERKDGAPSVVVMSREHRRMGHQTRDSTDTTGILLFDHRAWTHEESEGHYPFPYFFFMFIGLLFSWQSPECSRDLRFE